MTYGYDQISETMRLWLGVREGFCRLGFQSAEIFCEVVSPPGQEAECVLLLKAQGKEFTIGIGPVADPDAFEEEYHRVCEKVNDGTVPDADLQRIWDESDMRNNAGPILAAMTDKGFTFPWLDEQRRKKAN